MVFDDLKSNFEVTDDEFNSIYSNRIRNLARRHWTPVNVALKAARYLGEKPNDKVLDIGSGVGKFCFVGACSTPANYTGVEQRLELVHLSDTILKSNPLSNLKFIHSNITNMNFKEYNAFYFFNSFYENLDHSSIIDHTVEMNSDLFILYSLYVREQLLEMPRGTKLATYWTEMLSFDSHFKIIETDFDNHLKLWVKFR